MFTHIHNVKFTLFYCNIQVQGTYQRGTFLLNLSVLKYKLPVYMNSYLFSV